jgi:hypothetical protein
MVIWALSPISAYRGAAAIAPRERWPGHDGSENFSFIYIATRQDLQS